MTILAYVGLVSGVARILLKGVLKVNGQLAGHRGWGGRGMCPLPPKAEAFDFFNIELV